MNIMKRYGSHREILRTALETASIDDPVSLEILQRELRRAGYDGSRSHEELQLESMWNRLRSLRDVFWGAVLDTREHEDGARGMVHLVHRPPNAKDKLIEDVSSDTWLFLHAPGEQYMPESETIRTADTHTLDYSVICPSCLLQAESIKRARIADELMSYAHQMSERGYDIEEVYDELLPQGGVRG